MSRIDLQPGTAQAGITAAQSAGRTSAAATVPAGPIGTGALSMIDAAAGLAEFIAAAEEKARAGAVLARTNATGTAATATVTDLVVVDETNSQQFTAVGRDV